MKPRYFPMLGTIFAFTAAGGLLLPSAAPALSTDVESDEDMEVLTRGPVHEAFAEAVSYEPEEGMIVASAPPALIEEMPPDQQPDGDNVTWIPGYWAWDDDSSDFLWISGIWRNLPPDRQWVPGYWDELDGGRYQWVSGYWSDPEEEETTYIATAPPKSVDTGPNIDSPGDDHTWIPGNWRYQETRYVWSPGYYTPLRDNWTWVPSRYSWTPRGYVYVDGYWDYAVVNRGVLFAPIHYRRHVYTQPGYYYTPSIVVSLNVFAEHIFVRPRFRHYYFGDYYAPVYRDRGYYAPYAWHRARRGYDPIWAYQRWHHRHDHGWERRREDDFNFFRDNDRFRPPHNWAAMRSLRNERFDDDRGRSRLFANSFDGFVKNPDRGMKFHALNQERRQQFVTQRQQMRDFSRARRDLEAKPGFAANTGDNEGKKTIREKLRRSPVVGRQPAQFAGKDAPPARPEGRGGRNRGGDAVAGQPGGDDGKLTPQEKMRRAMGKGKGQGGQGGDATPGQPDRPNRGGATDDGAANDGKLTQQEKLRRAMGKGQGKGGQGGDATPGQPDRPNRGGATDDGAANDGKLTQQEKLRRAMGKGQGKGGQGGDGPAGPDADGPGRGANNDGAANDGKLTQKEKLRRAAGKGQGGDQAKKPDTAPAPKREVQPKREAQPQPKPQQKREVQPTPQRKAQPQPQPKREVQPTPQRKKEAAPQQRQVQPKQPQAPQRKQQQANPEKRKQPQKEQSSVSPQRRQQPQVAQRMAQTAPKARQQASQPKPQVRQAAPQRKQQQVAQARPQARQQAAPQRKQQAAPQRQVQRAPQQQAKRQQVQQRPQARQQAEKRGKKDKANN